VPTCANPRGRGHLAGTTGESTAGTTGESTAGTTGESTAGTTAGTVGGCRRGGPDWGVMPTPTEGEQWQRIRLTERLERDTDVGLVEECRRMASGDALANRDVAYRHGRPGGRTSGTHPLRVQGGGDLAVGLPVPA
jgi:hypothetical protein